MKERERERECGKQTKVQKIQAVNGMIPIYSATWLKKLIARIGGLSDL